MQCSEEEKQFNELPLLTPSAGSVNNEETGNAKNCEVLYSDFLVALQGQEPTVRKSTLRSASQVSEVYEESRLFRIVPEIKSNWEKPLNFGINPVMAHCPLCDAFVHTQVTFQDLRFVPKKVLRLFSYCCTVPDCITRLRIHKCPRCDFVLSK